MEKNEDKKRMFPLNMIRLCIDHYDGDIKGRVYSKMDKKPREFENCCEMLLRTDELFDENGYPQAFCDKRDFREGKVKGRYTPPKIQTTDEYLHSQGGVVCTLDILVRSRQRASWQGLITGTPQGEAKSFKSGKELLGHIQEIIQTEYTPSHSEI